MRYINNTLFIIYILLLFSALVAYVTWLNDRPVMNEICDDIINTIFIVLIGIFLILSVYCYAVYDGSIICPGISVFICFSIIIVINIYIDKYKPINSSNVNTSRKISYILGMLTIVPVLSISLLNYFDESLKVPVNLK